MVTPFAVSSAAREMQPLPAIYPHHHLSLYRDPEADYMPYASRQLLFLCDVFKWLILGLIFFSFFLLVTWMITNPTFPAMSVASASLSAFTFSSTNTSVSADCNVTLVLTNPNRHLTASHDRMEVSLLYAASQLAKFHHPPIVQPKSSRIVLQSNLSFSGVDLGSGVVSAMKQEMDRGSLGLTVEISSVVKYRNKIWKTKTYYMRGYCEGVRFGFASRNRPAIFLNPFLECEVYLFSKEN